jgi:hypothetical protein
MNMTNLLTEHRMGNTAAGKPEVSPMPDPVSSHAAAELQWAVSSLESQPRAVAGHYRDHPPEPETLRKDPPRLHHILIQGNMRACSVTMYDSESARGHAALAALRPTAHTR